MPKALCLTSLAIAILIAILFLIDVVMRLAGVEASAPLRGANLGMDIVFVVAGIAIAVLSWTTYKEQS